MGWDGFLLRGERFAGDGWMDGDCLAWPMGNCLLC